MTQNLLFILVILIGAFYANRNIKKAKENIAEYENKKTNKEIIQEIIELKYFGKIDLNKTEEYTDVLTKINGKEISIDLNFNEERISKKKIEPTIRLLENLSKIEKIAHNQILSDMENGDTVKLYVEHHLEEFTESELKSLGINPKDDLETKSSEFLNKIHLKRVGIYPEEWSNMAIFDYTINGDLTQYIVVVSFDSNGEFVNIDMES